ncbi:MAG: MFS transporter [Candidatus Geothermarchaeota archaeon]
MAKQTWIKWYFVAFILEGVGGGIYYAYSRPYLVDALGQEYGLLFSLLAAEFIPSITLVILGLLGDLLGRRALIIFGIPRLISYSLIPSVPIAFMPILVGVSVFLSSIAGVGSMGVVLEAGRGRGSFYANITTSYGIGWSIGGLIPGLASKLARSETSFLIAGLLCSMSSTILYLSSPPTVLRRLNAREFKTALIRTSRFLASITLTTASLSMFYSAISLVIYAEIRDLLIYGVFIASLSVIIGTATRPLAGLLVDKFNCIYIYSITLGLYGVLSYAILHSPCFVKLILWQIPLYPFRDVAQTMAISRGFPMELQSTAYGLTLTANALAGMVMLAIKEYVAKLPLSDIFLVHITLLCLGIFIVVPYKESVKQIKAFVHLLSKSYRAE